MFARTRVRVSVRETEISGWVYLCVRVGVWQAVTLYLGVDVKDENIDYMYAEY